jgi:DNA repair protein SbcD/Mre11
MSDSHLGFSNFNRVDKYGRNLVEEMIYQGFEQAVERIIHLKPDMLIHAGDIFHHVRPGSGPFMSSSGALRSCRMQGFPWLS